MSVKNNVTLKLGKFNNMFIMFICDGFDNRMKSKLCPVDAILHALKRSRPINLRMCIVQYYIEKPSILLYISQGTVVKGL